MTKSIHIINLHRILLAVACMCIGNVAFSAPLDQYFEFVREINVTKSGSTISIKHYRNDVDTTFQIPLYCLKADDTGGFINRMVDTMAEEDNFMVHFIRPVSPDWPENCFLLYSYALLTEYYQLITGILFTSSGKPVVLLDCDEDMLNRNHIIKTSNCVEFSTAPYSSFVFMPDIGNIYSVLGTEPDGKVNVYRLYSGQTPIQNATWLKNKQLFDWIPGYYREHGYSDTVLYYSQPRKNGN